MRGDGCYCLQFIDFFSLSFLFLFQVCSMQSSLLGSPFLGQQFFKEITRWVRDFLCFPCTKIAIPSKIIAPNSRGYIFLVLALIDTILGSKNIYSKRAFQRWMDWTNPMAGLRVMTILILLPLKNPKIIVHIWNVNCAMGCVGPMWTSKGVFGSFFPCFLIPIPSLICFQASLID